MSQALRLLPLPDNRLELYVTGRDKELLKYLIKDCIFTLG